MGTDQGLSPELARTRQDQTGLDRPLTGPGRPLRCLGPHSRSRRNETAPQFSGKTGARLCAASWIGHDDGQAVRPTRGWVPPEAVHLSRWAAALWNMALGVAGRVRGSTPPGGNPRCFICRRRPSRRTIPPCRVSPGDPPPPRQPSKSLSALGDGHGGACSGILGSRTAGQGGGRLQPSPKTSSDSATSAAARDPATYSVPTPEPLCLSTRRPATPRATSVKPAAADET